MTRRRVQQGRWSRWGDHTVQVEKREDEKLGMFVEAKYDVYLDGDLIGWVTKSRGTATRKITGTRIVAHGKSGAQIEWRFQLTSGQSTYPGLWRTSRVEAIADMVKRHNERTGN